MKTSILLTILICLISSIIIYNSGNITLEPTAQATLVSNTESLDSDSWACYTSCNNSVSNAVLAQQLQYENLLDPDTDIAYLLLLYGPECPSTTHHIDENCVIAWKAVYLDLFRTAFWNHYAECCAIGTSCCHLKCFSELPCSPSAEQQAVTCMSGYLAGIFSSLKHDLESCCIPNEN